MTYGVASRLRLPAIEAAGPLAVLAALKLVLNLLAWDRYGFHRDEWYYIVGGLHPAAGYVDHPPLTPLLAGLIYRIAGLELVAYRLVVGLAGAAVIVLAGLMARELGGGRTAQWLAGLAVLCLPIFAMTNLLFQTVPFDQLVWAVVILLFVRLLRRQEPRAWLWIGLAFGVGLLTKHTVALLAIALGVALLLTPARRWLGTRWPYLALGLAVLSALPNLIWQLANDFPTLEFIENNSANTREEFSRPALVFWQLFVPGFLALPLIGAGALWLFRAEGGRWRALGWLAVTPPLLVVLLQAKFYYSAPVLPLLCAGGAVAAERWIAERERGWRRPALVGALALNLLVILPFMVPLLPLERAHDLGVFDINGELAETVGWDELAAQVAEVYATLSPEEQARTRILTIAYGEAGALDLLGDDYGLPDALSAHNSYYHWGPGDDWDTLIVVGFRPARLEPHFEACEPAGEVRLALDIDNEINGHPLLICRGLRTPVDQWWEGLRTFH